MISFDCLGWIAAFILQVVLLGKNLYTLIQLEDLKMDKINPWDCAARVNRFLELENVAAALLATELVISRKWFSAIIHCGSAGYLAYLFVGRKLNMQAADAFKQVDDLRKRRFEFFIFHCGSFLFVTFRFLESVIHTVLTPEGRIAAKKLFDEAVVSIHGV
jgi:hypothetical protein